MAGVLSAGPGVSSLKGDGKGILSSGSEWTKLEVRTRTDVFEQLGADRGWGD